MGLMDMFAKWSYLAIFWEKFIVLLIVRLCLIVNFFILFNGIGCKVHWLCNCAIVTMLIVRLCNYYHVDRAIVIENSKICILIVRSCKNLHFDCLIVWKYAFWFCDCVKICNLIVHLCNCAWLCWLCVIV